MRRTMSGTFTLLNVLPATSRYTTPALEIDTSSDADHEGNCKPGGPGGRCAQAQPRSVCLVIIGINCNISISLSLSLDLYRPHCCPWAGRHSAGRLCGAV